MPKVLLVLVAAALLTAAVVVGVLINRSADEPDDRDEPAYVSTPLASYDTAGLAVTRGSFCDAVPEGAVAEAIGGEPGSFTAYNNGERARLVPGVRDVAHEFGCTWTGPGVTARAWVFAPPVTPRAARQLVREGTSAQGCAPVADAPAYGTPSAAAACDAGERTELSHRGLFGDAWLTCTLSATNDVPRPELTDRAGRWCVAVAEAARG